MQSIAAAKKLRAYMRRARRAVKVAHEKHPNMSPCQDTALELHTLKHWLNNGIAEIEQSGLDNWTQTV